MGARAFTANNSTGLQLQPMSSVICVLKWKSCMMHDIKPSSSVQRLCEWTVLQRMVVHVCVCVLWLCVGSYSTVAFASHPIQHCGVTTCIEWQWGLPVAERRGLMGILQLILQASKRQVVLSLSFLKECQAEIGFTDRQLSLNIKSGDGPRPGYQLMDPGNSASWNNSSNSKNRES